MKAFFSWSGGKDSMLALHRALEAGYEVAALLTMFDESGDRSRSHGLPPNVLQAQADALGIPLVTARASWQDYEAVMIRQLKAFAAEGISVGLFGDIDLQAHRDWEEKVCAEAGLRAELPLWGEERLALVQEFLALGYEARVVCINGRDLDRSFCGRWFDPAFVRDLPPGVDACGENGEFHTAVIAGPNFRQRVETDIAAIHELRLPEAQGGALYYTAELLLASGVGGQPVE